MEGERDIYRKWIESERAGVRYIERERESVMRELGRERVRARERENHR